MVSFELLGQPFMAMSAGPLFKFTPAVSFLVACKTREEADALWNGTLRQKIHEIERRRQVQVLESSDDRAPAMLKQVSKRVSQLEDERESTLAALAKLQNADPGLSPQGPIHLIDCLPLGNFEMAQAPEALLRRFRGVWAEDPLQQAN